MIRITIQLCLPIFIAAVCCGCGRPSWLARSRCGSVSMSDACRSWEELDQTRRDYYLDAENPGEEFVESMAMLQILEDVAENSGYNGSDRVTSFRESWLRTEAFIAWTEKKHREIVSGLTEEDMEFFAVFHADTAWITMFVDSRPDIETGLGFFTLPELPRSVASALQGIQEGASISFEEGIRLRLDRIAHSSAPRIIADSGSMWTIAQGQIRFLNLTALGREKLVNDTFIDTTAVLEVSRYFAGTIDTLSSDTVLLSRNLAITADQLALELEFFQTRLPVRPWEPFWVMMTLDNCILQAIRARELSEINPVLYDSLRLDADRFGIETALESLYEDSVTSKVYITGDDIMSEYSLLEETVTIPEKRVLLALHLPPGQSDAFVRALEAGNADEFADSLEGLPFLFPNEPVSRITGLLSMQDLPYGHGELVFSLPSGDNSWIGPLQSVHMTGSMIYRVLEISPEHIAQPDEIMPLLRQKAMERCEAMRSEEWMQALKLDYGFQLNIDTIAALPRDPGLWGVTPEE